MLSVVGHAKHLQETISKAATFQIIVEFALDIASLLSPDGQCWPVDAGRQSDKAAFVRAGGVW